MIWPMLGICCKISEASKRGLLTTCHAKPVPVPVPVPVPGPVPVPVPLPVPVPAGGSHCHEDPETELKLINASQDTNYLAYMFKYDTIHGKYTGPLRLMAIPWALMDTKIASSHRHDPGETPLAFVVLTISASPMVPSSRLRRCSHT